MSKDVEEYVKDCITCRTCKSTNTRKQGLMGKAREAQLPFQVLACDFIGPITKSTKQNSYLFVVSDWLSKSPSIVAVREATASKVISVLENDIFMAFGVPQTLLIADDAKVITCKAFLAFLAKYGVNIKYNSYYHTQHNFVERTNKTIGNMLRCYCKDNQRLWDSNIPQLQLALRTVTNEITGYTPHFLVLGREMIMNTSDYNLLVDDKANKPTDQFSKTHIDALEDRTSHFKTALTQIKLNHSKNKQSLSK